VLWVPYQPREIRGEAKENKKEMMYGNASRSATGHRVTAQDSKKKGIPNTTGDVVFGSWLVRSEVGRALTWEKVCFCGVISIRML